MSLDLGRLRIFLEAARLGSYTHAGARLHTSQSAVSHAIRRLEESAGRRLIEWRGRRLTLTAEGEALLEVCERVFAELEAAERTLLHGASEAAVRFSVGATVEFGTTVLMERMAPLLEAHPGLHIDFTFSHSLLAPLLRGDLDLIVDCVEHEHGSLSRTALFREKYAIVAAPKLIRAVGLRASSDLGRAALLSMDARGQWWERVHRAMPTGQHQTSARLVTINHLRGIVNAAVAGVGVGLVPKYTVLRELADGRLRELFADLGLREDFFSIYQKRALAGREVNRLVTAFLLGLDTSGYGDSIGSVRRADNNRG